MEPIFDGNAPLTTYEQASLSLQQANVDAALAGVATQQAGNEIALRVGVGQATAALTVGLIQAGVVGWGIRYMARMSERREQQHADRHAETMRALDHQHTATMRALEVLIERTAPRRAQQPAAWGASGPEGKRQCPDSAQAVFFTFAL